VTGSIGDANNLIVSAVGSKGHAAAEFSGDLSRESMPPHWKRVIEQLKSGTRGKGLDIQLKQETVPSYQEIMEEYMK
jgi:hypothetical protein